MATKEQLGNIDYVIFDMDGLLSEYLIWRVQLCS
jgi:hypothetical protein